MIYDEDGKITNPKPATESVISEINSRNRSIYSAEPTLKSSTSNVSSSIFDKVNTEKKEKKDD